MGRKWHRVDSLQESIPIICDTSQCIIPSHERGEESEIATRFIYLDVFHAVCALQACDSKKQEGHVKEEEEEEEGNGRTKRAEQQDEGEDEPANEEEAECVVEVIGAGTGSLSCSIRRCVRADNVKPSRREYDSEGEPEAAVGGERGSTKSVSYCHLPVMGLAASGNGT